MNIDNQILTAAGVCKLNAYKDNPAVVSSGLISTLELCYLMALFSEENDIYGPIAEVGCRDGATTSWLAGEIGNHRMLYAVDCVKQGQAYIPAEQKSETPSWEAACIKARDLPNVCYMNVDSGYNSFAYPPISAAFIDGNHTYAGVETDYTKLKIAGCRLFVFHDAHNVKDYPWIEVPKFVQTLLRNAVNYIPNTKLAVYYE